MRPEACVRTVAGEGSEPLAFQPLPLHLAGAANGLGSLTGAAFGGLFIVPAQFHFPENAFPLHLLLERFERLIDIVFTNEDLHLAAISFSGWAPPTIGGVRNLPRPVALERGPRLDGGEGGAYNMRFLARQTIHRG